MASILQTRILLTLRQRMAASVMSEASRLTFVFKPGFGANTIVNAQTTDIIELDGFSSVTSTDQLQTYLNDAANNQAQPMFQAANGGHDTVINLGNNDVITVANVQLTDLHASNFIIHA